MLMSFFSYTALKMELELILLKNELLRKNLSRVEYKKDICTPHMNNAVQNK